MQITTEEIAATAKMSDPEVEEWAAKFYVKLLMDHGMMETLVDIADGDPEYFTPWSPKLRVLVRDRFAAEVTKILKIKEPN